MDFKIGSFDPSSMTWDRYSEQLKFFLEANKVEEKLKLATILTVVGNEIFNLLCDLIAPCKPIEKTAEEVMEILNQHYNPKPLARIERFKLRERLQLDHESAADYAAQLRKLAINCDLNERLEFVLSEQFIYGLKDFSIKKRLIVEKTEINLTDLVKLATAAEISSKDLIKLENKSTEKSAYLLKKNTVADSNPQNNYNYKKRNSCKHCGALHLATECKYKNAICNCCKKKGHIKPICRYASSNVQNKRKANIHKTEDQLSECATIINSHESLNQIINTQPIMLKLVIDGKQCEFEFDTGASISLMPISLFKANWPNRRLDYTNVTLRAFDHVIVPLGTTKVTVEYNNKIAYNLELFVTKAGNTSLLGRSWIHALGFTCDLFKEIHIVDSSQCKLKEILTKFSQLFDNKLGFIKNFEAKLYLKKDSTPKFCKHRTAPFALLPAIEVELNKLKEQGIITPIKYSRWASPIVPILKKNGTLRICADYKVGLNKCLKVDHYPLPVIDDILAKLSKGKIFSKLDMAQAYQQVKMDSTSSELLTINTHLGLYAVSRLPFGIASAPAIFQGLMDNLFKKHNNVVCYLDDILIASPDITTHFNDIENILNTLLENGIRLNLDKCEFLKSEVEYLGHIVNGEGIKPNPAKLKALVSAPVPNNLNQLRSFMGLLGYYRKFVPDLATKVNNLNALLSNKTPWIWNDSCKQEFDLIKKMITSDQVLAHYDPNKPLILAADASPYGIGAILSHLFPDKTEKPVMFASRSLTQTERNYSQLDREALGIIFAIKKFHKYIFGRKFTLYTDHKPLTHILNCDKEIPTIAASRLQRWSLILAGYSYDIKYRPSKQHANADALSRLPINDESSAEENFENVFLIQQDEKHFPWTKQDIASQSKLDPELFKIINYIKNGWPKNKSKNDKLLSYYFQKKDQLSLQDDCLLWGLRVVIPSVMRTSVLKELHQCHIGITKMKLLAKSICWWPNIDQNIETEAKTCRICQLHQKDPPKAILHPWIRPSGPWSRIHTDLMGPYKNKMFLVTVDSFSKWPEVQALSKADSKSIMLTLEEYFVRFGYPEHIVSDNGTPFTSSDFEQFCSNRGILHTKSPPFHPASNGQAERFVDIAKRLLNKVDVTKDSEWQIKINELLFKYRCTPHATLKLSPAELLFGHPLRSRLQKLNPLPIIPPIAFKNKYHIGQNILARAYGVHDKYKWKEGKISKILSPVTFKIILRDGREVKRHYNQIRTSYLTNASPESQPQPHTPILDYKDSLSLLPPQTPLRKTPDITITQPVHPSVSVPIQETHHSPIPPPRHSTRLRRPPQRLNYKL